MKKAIIITFALVIAAILFVLATFLVAGMYTKADAQATVSVPSIGDVQLRFVDAYAAFGQTTTRTAKGVPEAWTECRAIPIADDSEAQGLIVETVQKLGNGGERSCGNFSDRKHSFVSASCYPVGDGNARMSPEESDSVVAAFNYAMRSPRVLLQCITQVRSARYEEAASAEHSVWLVAKFARERDAWLRAHQPPKR